LADADRQRAAQVRVASPQGNLIVAVYRRRFVSDPRGAGIVFTAGPFIRETQAQPADDIHFVTAIAKYRFSMDGKVSPSDAPFPVVATLFGLTFVTGLIDGVSFLGLGHVFTANMTGNVVFVGFTLGGAADLSILRRC
jgi:hypothetical protein